VSYLVVQTSSGSGRPEGDSEVAPAQKSIAISMPSPECHQAAMPQAKSPLNGAAHTIEAPSGSTQTADRAAAAPNHGLWRAGTLFAKAQVCRF